jgi:hypothetical protein
MPAIQSVWNVDWLNANAQRNYPLFEDADRKDTSDSLQLPNDLIVDLVLPVHPDPSVDPTLFHVQAVSVFGDGVTVTFGYDGTVFASVTVPLDAAKNTQYLFQGTGDFHDSVGKVVIGSLETILTTAGSFEFSVTSGRLESTVIRPDLRGVSSIRIQNGDEIGDPIQGDVILQAGRNMTLQFVSGLTGEPDRVQFNAIDGEGFNADCDCSEAADLPCIKTINGIEPDDAGDFTLLGDDCLQLSGIANGIQIVDDCAKPCCGCEELEVVITEKERMLDQIYQLERLATNLEAQMRNLEINLAGSS